MEFNQQIFTAPNIPKISKKTISSSVLTGAVKPQLKLSKSTFSFVKPTQKVVDTEKISQPILTSNTKIENELIETNNILTQIQKQLEIDFAYRIKEEKNALALQKKKIARQKVSDKEAKIEKGGKSILGKTFEKVTAPFKSIFQKLIDFFSIILTGILVNNAFEWLKDENNRKKLTAFFDFIKEYWQELLIIFAAYKLAKLVGVIFGIGLKLKKLVTWFRAFAFPKKPPIPSNRPIPPSLTNPQLGRVNAAHGRFIAGKSNFIDRIKLFQNRYIGLGGLFTKGGFNEAGSLRGQELKLPKMPQFKMPSFGGAKLPQLPAWANLGNLLRILAVAESGRRFKEGDIMGGTLAGGSALPIVGYPMFALDMLRNIYGKDFFDKVVGQAYSGEIGLSDKEIERRQKGSALERALTTPSLFGGMSMGGTVGRGDRPGVDTTPTQIRGGGKVLLDAGEEVIRKSSSMLFRPLLKDINDNAGRMWTAFSEGIRIQDENTKMQFEITEKFGDIIKKFKDYVESEIRKSKMKNVNEDITTTTPTPPSPPSPPQLPSSPTAPASTSPSTSSSQSGEVIPEASKPGAPGIPGRTDVPKIGEGVGTAPQAPTLPPPSSQTFASVDSGESIERELIVPPTQKEDDKMLAWEKANPLLALEKKERDRTRGTNETTNPLMGRIFGSEYISKLPSPKTKKSLVKEKSSEGKISVLNLPPISGKKPQQEKSGKVVSNNVTAIPSISSFDSSNPYPSFALKTYGIVGMDKDDWAW